MTIKVLIGFEDGLFSRVINFINPEKGYSK